MLQNSTHRCRQQSEDIRLHDADARLHASEQEKRDVADYEYEYQWAQAWNVNGRTSDQHASQLDEHVRNRLALTARAIASLFDA